MYDFSVEVFTKLLKIMKFHLAMIIVYDVENSNSTSFWTAIEKVRIVQQFIITACMPLSNRYYNY